MRGGSFHVFYAQQALAAEVGRSLLRVKERPQPRPTLPASASSEADQMRWIANQALGLLLA